jgi:hypothetical protein
MLRIGGEDEVAVELLGIHDLCDHPPQHQIQGHGLRSGARLAHHVHQGATQVESPEEGPGRLGIGIVQHVEAWEVASILVGSLVPALPQERLSERDRAESGPPDPQDHDVLEPLAEPVGQLLHGGRGGRIRREIEEAHVTRLPAPKHRLVRLGKPCGEVLVQSGGIDSAGAQSGDEGVGEVQDGAAHGAISRVRPS